AWVAALVAGAAILMLAIAVLTPSRAHAASLTTWMTGSNLPQGMSGGGANTPVDLRSHPTDPERIYIGLKSGYLIMRYNGTASVVLNFSSLVGSGPEDGLISFALAPNFPNSGKFYV